MTHQELRSVVLNHVPLAYQQSLLVAIRELERLRQANQRAVTRERVRSYALRGFAPTATR